MDKNKVVEWLLDMQAYAKRQEKIYEDAGIVEIQYKNKGYAECCADLLEKIDKEEL